MRCVNLLGRPLRSPPAPNIAAAHRKPVCLSKKQSCLNPKPHASLVPVTRLDRVRHERELLKEAEPDGQARVYRVLGFGFTPLTAPPRCFRGSTKSCVPPYMSHGWVVRGDRKSIGTTSCFVSLIHEVVERRAQQPLPFPMPMKESLV